jgi:23S rRNA (uracil1939-C5)-methyltransferase
MKNKQFLEDPHRFALPSQSSLEAGEVGKGREQSGDARHPLANRERVSKANSAIETARIEVETMTFGRSAITHLNGKVVMIPGAAPGDLLDVEVTSELRRFSLARVVRIVRAGAERRKPPCEYASNCGGCDWQHIRYEGQIRHKAELLAAEFRRGLAIQLDRCGLVEPAPAELGYRSRVRLKIGPHGEVGFTRAGTNSLVAIDSCPVTTVGIATAARLAHALGHGCREIEVVAGERGEVLVADLAKAPTAFAVAQAQRIVENGAAGIILRGGGVREVAGNATIMVEAEPGCVIQADADLFTQVNREQNLKLVAAAMRLAHVSAGTRVLDLFCGTGNFSLPAARRGADVTGADVNPLAIEAARANAARMGLRATQFIAMRAAEAVRFLWGAGYNPEVIIMDPPRTGAADLIEPLAKLGARRVIYVSCDPLTLVRDLRSLTGKGYRIEQVRAFDFFPNTRHLEILVTVLLT